MVKAGRGGKRRSAPPVPADQAVACQASSSSSSSGAVGPQAQRLPVPCPLSEVLAIGVPTLRHVPGEVRPALQQALASALRDFLVHKDLLSL